MRDWPAEIKVGALKYTPMIVCQIDDNDSLAGSIDHTQCIIEVVANASREAMAATLWHEVVHAILTQCGFTEGHIYESAVQALGYHLPQFIVENHDLVEWTKKMILELTNE